MTETRQRSLFDSPPLARRSDPPSSYEAGEELRRSGRLDKQRRAVERLEVALREIIAYAPLAGDCGGKAIARAALAEEEESDG